FVVNRILGPYLNEAVLLLAEGMSIEAVDRTMRRFGMPMGPLELLDQIGLDGAAHVARTGQDQFAGRFPPNPPVAKMCECGWLGQKNGTGFYYYRGKKKRPRPVAAVVARHALGEQAMSLTKDLPPAAGAQRARERMVCLMVNEAAACLGEGLAES